MKRNVVLYIAISLDGYIADTDGNIDWLTDAITFTEEDNSYDLFYQTIDTVLMGSTTYNQVTEVLSPNDYPYENAHSYVFTSKKRENLENVTFVNDNVVNVVKKLKNEPGKDIWIVGGSSLVTPLINTQLINRFEITLIPTILGKGIPLFQDIEQRQNVTITHSRLVNGMLSYSATPTQSQ